jgi:hypothetical protein
MKELYGIDLPVTVRLFEGARRQPISQQMVVRVPGWVDFGILRWRQEPLVVHAITGVAS